MILIGQYDSPFVRRVAIAMRLYGFAYEHRPWSTFADADKLSVYNPLHRPDQAPHNRRPGLLRLHASVTGCRRQ
jgi:hypothetical protein